MDEPETLAAQYPLFLSVRHRLCVVIGGGTVATRRVRGLHDAGAIVRVIAPAISPDLHELARGNESMLILEQRPYQSGDLEGALLVYAATSVREVNAAVAADAHRLGILLNVADMPADGDFVVPSVVRRDPLAVAISTSGGHPGLAAALRRWLDTLLTEDFSRAARHLTGLRRQRRQTPTNEPDRMSKIEQQALDLLAEGRASEAVILLQQLASGAQD